MSSFNKYCIGMLCVILLGLGGVVAFAVLGALGILPEPVCFGSMMGLGATTIGASILTIGTIYRWGW